MVDVSQRHDTVCDDERGFTLIELTIVVMIIGILLLIAIPTFAAAQDRAADRAAQSNLRNALTAERVFFSDNQTFADTSTPADLTGLVKLEPSLNWAAATATTPSGGRDVATTVTGATSVVIEVKSKTGECWYIADLIAPSTVSGTFYGSNKSGCGATNPPAPTVHPAAGSFSTGTTPTSTSGWGLSFGT